MCIGIIAKDAVVAIIEDIIIPATVTVIITAIETMLTPTTILATEAEVPATAVRRVRDSIRGVVEPAAVAGTIKVMGTEIDTIRTTK